MFDFGSNQQKEFSIKIKIGSYDRKQSKAYRYKANWNKKKNNHWPKTEERIQGIYNSNENFEMVEIGKMNTDDYATVIWKNVKLNQGKNIVEIETRGNVVYRFMKDFRYSGRLLLFSFNCYFIFFIGN